jgi:hypothetical protein
MSETKWHEFHDQAAGQRNEVKAVPSFHLQLEELSEEASLREDNDLLLSFFCCLADRLEVDERSDRQDDSSEKKLSNLRKRELKTKLRNEVSERS